MTSPVGVVPDVDEDGIVELDGIVAVPVVAVPVVAVPVVAVPVVAVPVVAVVCVIDVDELAATAVDVDDVPDSSLPQDPSTSAAIATQMRVCAVTFMTSRWAG